MKAPQVEQIAPNFTRVLTDQGSFWYSYKTLIAVKPKNGKLIIRENDWSTTTGKHLNAVNSDKSLRISGVDFEREVRGYKV